MNELVLSGIFSGCLMTAYQIAGAATRRIAHVHTGSEGGEDCKDAFKTLLQSPGYTQLANFKPFRRKEEGDKVFELAQKFPAGGQIPSVFGIITANLKLYTLILQKTAGNSAGTIVTTFTVRALNDRADEPIG